MHTTSRICEESGSAIINLLMKSFLDKVWWNYLSIPEKLDSGHTVWTLGLWMPGRLDSGRLEIWTLDVWKLGFWRPGHLDSRYLDAWTLDNRTLGPWDWMLRLWKLGLRTLGPKIFYPFLLTSTSFLSITSALSLIH